MPETAAIATPQGSFSAYVAKPAAERAPAIVVIQEIFGVNAVMRQITDDFARRGYLAICPDLFWRIEPGVDITDRSDAEWKKAFALYNAFDVDRGVADIGAAIDYARGQPACAGSVGAIGFCLGGLLAFLAATRTDADASVSYYGVGIQDRLTVAASIRKPLLLHIAEEDEFTPKAAQAQIRSALGPRPSIEIFTYPGRNHAFARPGGDHYDASDAALAQARTLAFLERRL
jgi:carboxymethylenebutenolidase